MSNVQVFPAGLLGSFYAVRHDLGLFRSAAVAGTYELAADGNSQSSDRVMSSLRTALSETIQQHPALQFSVKYDPDVSAEASFIHHSLINLNDVLKFKCASTVTHDLTISPEQRQLQQISLERELERIYCDFFVAPDSIPSWRLMVLRYDGTWADPLPAGAHIDIIFAFHHALADGISGLSFHRTIGQRLRRQLRLKDSAMAPEQLHLPPVSKPPPKMERLLDFPVKDNLDYRKWSNTLFTNPRQGELTHANGPDVVANLRILEVPATQLSRILRLCKEHHITLTGLLHGFIVAFLARHWDEFTQVNALTPCSMRQYTKTSKDDIVNHISYSDDTFPLSLLQQLRDCPPDSGLELNLLVEIARSSTDQMKRELNKHQTPRLLQDAALFLSMSRTSHVSPLDQDTRMISYELSNLGAESVVAVSDPDDLDPVSLAKMVFSQSNTGIAPRIVICCVSLHTGPLVVTVSWNGGTLCPGLVDGLVSYLANRCAEVDNISKEDNALQSPR